MDEKKKVAVGCWFTSNGRTIPKIIRYEDDNGSVHTLSDIHLVDVQYKEGPYKCAQLYDCIALVDGLKCSFQLLFHPGDNIWELFC